MFIIKAKRFESDEETYIIGIYDDEDIADGIVYQMAINNDDDWEMVSVEPIDINRTYINGHDGSDEGEEITA